MTVYSGEDWGFNAAGTPLGGTSALSMPGPRAIDFHGAPVPEAAASRRAFTNYVERNLENVNPHNAGLWDPRGYQALSSNPSDHYEGVHEIDATIKDFDQEAKRIMDSGNPQLGAARPNNNANFQVLGTPATGLSRETAETMAQALSHYKPETLEGMYIPNDIQPTQLTSELGLTTVGGRAPLTYLDQNLGPQDGPGLADAALIAAQAQRPRYTQSVDDNGIVFNKYSPGTGPYDAPGRTRPGGIAGAMRGTYIEGADHATVAQGIVDHQDASRNVRLNTAIQQGYSPKRGSALGAMDTRGSSMENGYASAGGAFGALSGDEAMAETSSNTGAFIGLAGLGLLAMVGIGMLAKGASK